MIQFNPPLNKPSKLTEEEKQILSLFEFGSLWQCTHERYDDISRLRIKTPFLFTVLDSDFYLFGDDQGFKMLKLTHITAGKTIVETLFMHGKACANILSKLESDFVRLC